MEPRNLDRAILAYLARRARELTKDSSTVFGQRTAKATSGSYTVRVLAPGLNRLVPNFRKHSQRAHRDYYISTVSETPNASSSVETIYRFRRREGFALKRVLTYRTAHPEISDDSLEELPSALPESIYELYHNPLEPQSWHVLEFPERATRQELAELVDIIRLAR
jgi:hypothetical protein